MLRTKSRIRPSSNYKSINVRHREHRTRNNDRTSRLIGIILSNNILPDEVMGIVPVNYDQAVHIIRATKKRDRLVKSIIYNIILYGTRTQRLVHSDAPAYNKQDTDVVACGQRWRM